MNNKPNRWSLSQLKTYIVASQAAENAIMIGLCKNVVDNPEKEEQVRLANLSIQDVCQKADKILASQKLDIILVAENPKTKENQMLKSNYASLKHDREKLKSTDRVLLDWFPVNFSSLDEWFRYVRDAKNEINAMLGKRNQAVSA